MARRMGKQMAMTAHVSTLPNDQAGLLNIPAKVLAKVWTSPGHRAET